MGVRMASDNYWNVKNYIFNFIQSEFLCSLWVARYNKYTFRKVDWFLINDILNIDQTDPLFIWWFFFYSIRWMPELQEMIGQMKDKIANRLKPKRKNLPTTGNFIH